MHMSGTGPIRRTLYLGMALALAVGLGVFTFFSFYTTGQVRSILHRDLGDLAALASRSLERDHAFLVRRGHDLAASKALHVILQLDVPLQARLFLEANARLGPFTRFWLLRPDGTPYAGFPGDAGPPPALPAGADSAFLPLADGLGLAVRSPIAVGRQNLGALVAATAFPDQNLLEGFSRPGDTGLALWLGSHCLARSAWLQGVGYAEAGEPGKRARLDLTWEGRSFEFLARSAPLAMAPPTILRLEMIRSLDHAREPFRHLLAAFFAGWVVILVSFLLFTRTVNVRLIEPILDLSRTAGAVDAHANLPPQMQGWLEAPAANEIAVLRRAFASTVTSLHQALVQAEAADRAKGDFLSTVSHELRTPLTSILGFAKMVRKRLAERIAPALARDPDPRTAAAAEQAGENLDIILAEAAHLTALIDDVLDLTRLEDGALDWAADEVDVPGLVEEAVAGFLPAMQAKGLECRIRLAPDLPRIPGDRGRLLQVLHNLLSNAAKFTPDGSVEVRAAREQDGVRLTVADTGPGIPGAERERIFDTFHQSGGHLTDKPKGTGLGLAVSRLIVHHHGGRIWVDSRPGRGSAFSVFLPAATPAGKS